jgi:hypothetical protein
MCNKWICVMIYDRSDKKQGKGRDMLWRRVIET